MHATSVSRVPLAVNDDRIGLQSRRGQTSANTSTRSCLNNSPAWLTIVGTNQLRVANACIGAERADLVLAGCAILEAIRRAFPCRRLRVADRGLREGMLVRMMRDDGVWSRDFGEGRGP